VQILTLTVILLSALLQLAAAICAVLLIKITGKKHVWILVCAAIILMVGRRIISFDQSLQQFEFASWDFANDLIGLAISLLMFLGIYGIRSIFMQQRQAEKALREFDRLKMSALQRKSDPHFLFNALNSIVWLIAEKKEGAEDALHKLSDIYRYIVDMADRDIISLEEGLKILRSYFDLEQLRFGDRLKLNVTIEGDISDVYLPGLTLQPIVENSIKHGFSPRGGCGNVTIAIMAKEGKARIAIRDDGVGCDSIKLAVGHGLKIVRARLDLCFGKQFAMEMHGERDKGTTTVITIPLRASAGIEERI
jgi:LytS/YehU family sensor histidine kinase